MNGIVIAPGLFGSVCAFALLLWALFGLDRWLTRQEMERRREARRQELRDALAGLPQRHARIADDEIDHTYVSGGE